MSTPDDSSTTDEGKYSGILGFTIDDDGNVSIDHQKTYKTFEFALKDLDGGVGFGLRHRLHSLSRS